ncbi:hypothetical protein J7E62_00010 [Variovorax paradoxus]|nr:hypothetical protein [Variovorax paradoxus]
MLRVSIELGKAIDVAHTDNIIEIGGVGKLIFSKGSVEWQSSPNSRNQRTFTWKEFRKVLEGNGSPAVAKKAAGKAGPAVKKVGLAKRTKASKPVSK